MRVFRQILNSIVLVLGLVTLSRVAICDEVTRAEVTQLIKALGSQDYQARVQATEELKGLGIDAFDVVKSAVHSEDIEVSHRCLKILEFWLQSENGSLVQAADVSLRELESSDENRIRMRAHSARRNTPERLIVRLEKLGARFSYREDHEVQSIDLSRQGVRNRDVATLHTFHEVESIDLDYTEITSEVFTTFQNFSELRELHLRCACLQDDHLQSLQTLSRLEQLNLWRTGITDRGLAHLARLKTLKELNLGYNCITDEGLTHLSQMQELTTLNLVRTDITDRGLRKLANLPKLKSLKVSGSRVTTETIHWLQNKRPELQIRWDDTCHKCRKSDSRPLRPVTCSTPLSLE